MAGILVEAILRLEEVSVHRSSLSKRLSGIRVTQILL